MVLRRSTTLLNLLNIAPVDQDPQHIRLVDLTHASVWAESLALLLYVVSHSTLQRSTGAGAQVEDSLSRTGPNRRGWRPGRRISTLRSCMISSTLHGRPCSVLYHLLVHAVLCCAPGSWKISAEKHHTMHAPSLSVRRRWRTRCLGCSTTSSQRAAWCGAWSPP